LVTAGNVISSNEHVIVCLSLKISYNCLIISTYQVFDARFHDGGSYKVPALEAFDTALETEMDDATKSHALFRKGLLLRMMSRHGANDGRTYMIILILPGLVRLCGPQHIQNMHNIQRQIYI
jgi:hypothetical protein